MRQRLLLIVLLLAAQACAQAPPLARPAPPQAQYQPHPGALLPLDAAFTDDSARSVRLGTYFGERPVLLVLGYYHCPNLCSTLMDGVLEALAEVRLPPDAYRVLGVSIDPGEDAALAARKKSTYAALLTRAGGELHLLTGKAADIGALTQSTGLRYAYDAATRQYAHPAGFLVATRDGRISHYFPGVRFDARALRLALVEASDGRIGSPAERLFLLCSHYDPVTGRYSGAAMALVRALCLAVLAALLFWLWRTRRRTP